MKAYLAAIHADHVRLGFRSGNCAECTPPDGIGTKVPVFGGGQDAPEALWLPMATIHHAEGTPR